MMYVFDVIVFILDCSICTVFLLATAHCLHSECMWWVIFSVFFFVQNNSPARHSSPKRQHGAYPSWMLSSGATAHSLAIASTKEAPLTRYYSNCLRKSSSLLLPALIMRVKAKQIYWARINLQHHEGWAINCCKKVFRRSKWWINLRERDARRPSRRQSLPKRPPAKHAVAK